jgi:hypothetical protein
VPFGFPSHQGLLAPLWRRWPQRFSVVALWIGALVPDVIDGVTSIALRGRPGQWMGHSFVGLFAFCVPTGLALTFLARRVGARVAPMWMRDVENASGGVVFDATSIGIGALSHVVFDLVSHEHSMLLWPWAEDPLWFGPRWQATWFRVSPPGYADYSIGPHFVGWVFLSVVGAVLFFKYPPRRA